MDPRTGRPYGVGAPPHQSYRDHDTSPAQYAIAAAAAEPPNGAAPSMEMRRHYLTSFPESTDRVGGPAEMTEASAAPPKAPWSSRFKTYLHNALQAPMFKPKFSPDAPIWLLGELYGAPAAGENGGHREMGGDGEGHIVDLMDDLKSRLWFSYREGFSEIGGSTLTTDMGWGCMIRSGQMMLAQAILMCTVGRGFRCGSGDPEVYREILHLFYDSPECPFSIHNILRLAADYGVKPGTWLGPSIVCLALAAAVRDAIGRLPPSLGLATRMTVYVVQDCLVSRAEVAAAARARDDGACRPVFIMIPLRLGVSNKLNKLYIAGLQSLFSHRECVGVVGGKPRHSVYFVGFQGDEMIALDPHLCQPIVDPGSASVSTATYHCSNPRKVKFISADPSLAIGFLCRNEGEIERFYAISQSQDRSSPLYSVGP
eukprot:m.452716 g.452716  ORF g.452716 m.452716 type:complete len:427 (-) comp20387_c0_seq1:72-1352(-)